MNRIRSLPHARGGVSVHRVRIRQKLWSSPRTWGCFFIHRVGAQDIGVFPTHVGVFPSQLAFLCLERSLPHARGGVSTGRERQGTRGQSSPRTWGCFPGDTMPDRLADVFPTHVGVFPRSRHDSSGVTRLPHARGGVSMGEGRNVCMLTSSPRTWGCF